MQVSLIDYTGAGTPDPARAAANLLVFTKSTRLAMEPGLLGEIAAWPQEKIDEELAYMAKTIKSSWEFCQLTFLVRGVTRATAQQMTRTRNASYAMQSQRVTDARSIAVTNNLAEGSEARGLYDAAVDAAKFSYAALVDAGVPLEEARGLLPMNTQCNLVVSYNLRTLTDLVKARKSLRAQGEYNAIVREMEACVLAVWPWAAPFFESDNAIAIAMLEEVARRIGITTGRGDGWEIAKAIDLLRKA